MKKKAPQCLAHWRHFVRSFVPLREIFVDLILLQDLTVTDADSTAGERRRRERTDEDGDWEPQEERFGRLGFEVEEGEWYDDEGDNDGDWDEDLVRWFRDVFLRRESRGRTRSEDESRPVVFVVRLHWSPPMCPYSLRRRSWNKQVLKNNIGPFYYHGLLCNWVILRCCRLYDTNHISNHLIYLLHVSKYL